MTWLQFISSMTGALAWPLAAVVIAILFRDQIRRLIMKIRKIAAGGVSLELAETIEAVKDQAKLVEAEAEKSAVHVVTLDPTTVTLLARNPEAAVLEEFKELEGTLLQIRSLLPGDKPRRTAYETLRQLNDLGYIGANVVALYMTLRHVRHQVATGESNIEPRDAEAIVREMRMIAELLRRGAEQLRSGKK